MAKSKAGRPSVMTDETIRKLEEAFRWGCSDTEACLHANIAKSTLYLYCQDNPLFSERKEDLKNAPTLRAKEIVSKDLKDGKDINTAKWVIEKKEGKAKQAIDHASPDGTMTPTVIKRVIINGSGATDTDT